MKNRNEIARFLAPSATVVVSLIAATSAFAVGPATLADLGTQVVSDSTSNTPMIFTIMGAVLTISVLLMVFYKGKKVAK